MDPLTGFLAGVKSAWISISFLVAVVIWVYKLRADTNRNTEDFNSYKESTNKRLDSNSGKISTISAQVDNKITEVKHNFELKIEQMESKMHNEIRSIKTEVKSDLKEHAETEVNRAIRIFEKLEEIQRDLVDVKVAQAKNGQSD
jgi:hypothetical protein|tara:strand:+ start:1291 stop:1722 length:432 start_codon:yes stop_codon:yes gene_type:complete